MFYSAELKLICDTMKKLHLTSAVITTEEPISEILDSSVKLILSPTADLSRPISDFVGDVKDQTIYKMSIFLSLNYMYMLLPDTTENTLLMIGPYLTRSLSNEDILELGETHGLSPKTHKSLVEYISSIPVLDDTSHIFLLIDTFAERIWKGASFSVVDLESDKIPSFTAIGNRGEADSLDSELLNISIMEKRYQYENELIQAVTLGQIGKANALLSTFASTPFEKRLADPIRNFKNYAIIMNTLLRKAAEAGGVHPVYLDVASSGFASKIENVTSTSAGNELMHEMFKGYCRLVRKHSMKSYSPIVQKSVIFIDSNLSSSLTLSSVAEAQNVSSGYLSTIFRKETGKTITEYIAERRVAHASHLLSTTHLQIQTVALHCGIMDVQYFSKIFKKYTGKTPKEYRDSTKK